MFFTENGKFSNGRTNSLIAPIDLKFGILA